MKKKNHSILLFHYAKVCFLSIGHLFKLLLLFANSCIFYGFLKIKITWFCWIFDISRDANATILDFVSRYIQYSWNIQNTYKIPKKPYWFTVFSMHIAFTPHFIDWQQLNEALCMQKVWYTFGVAKKAKMLNSLLNLIA